MTLHTATARRAAVIALLAVLAVSPVSQAQAEKAVYTFDHPHTQVMFAVSHVGFTSSHGSFRDYSGQFIFDEKQPEQTQVDITIQTASLDMGDSKWEEALLARDFFDVKQYPVMTFKSTRVALTGSKTAQLTGELTLHGVTKPVTLDVVYNRSGVHPLSRMFEAGFSAHGKIMRSDFGMTTSIPMVGDTVDIEIEAEGIRQTPQLQPK